MAGVTSLVNTLTADSGIVANLVVRATLGGTEAVMGGGKFLNGARSAAYEYLLKGAAQIAANGGISLDAEVDKALDFAGKIWNWPNTAIGLVYGGIGYVAGVIAGTNPTIQIGNNAIEFLRNPLNVSAVTLGNTINYGPLQPGDPSPESRSHTVGQHELQHTYQGQALGPLYLPTAILSLGTGLIVNGNTHGPASFVERGPQRNPPRPW